MTTYTCTHASSRDSVGAGSAIYRRLFSRLAALSMAVMAGSATTVGLAQTCDSTNSGVGNIDGVVNTYYTPIVTEERVWSGNVNIPLTNKRGALADIAPGDLVLVIQMQCADIDSSNTSSYGSGQLGQGRGYIEPEIPCRAGRYEFTRALEGSNANRLIAKLNNPYIQTPAAQALRRSFQVIRVPQYASFTVTGTLRPEFWDGNNGGVFAIDVVGQLDWNNGTIDASGRGFRGGGSRQTTWAYLNLPVYTTGDGRWASKGEGIAGTPRLVRDAKTGLLIDYTAAWGGYFGGDYAKGAPGNAGGGGGSHTDRWHNSGGGGGGNWGAGGSGGHNWQNWRAWSAYPSYPDDIGAGDMRGIGGDRVPVTMTRVFMGGGGGAGHVNSSPFLGHGGAGGGIVMVRAGSMVGGGNIKADGVAGASASNDGAGGGGAGGTVIVFADQGPLSDSELLISARGGVGGSAYLEGNLAHGPGGGGGGGAILLSDNTNVRGIVDAGKPGVTPCGSGIAPQFCFTDPSVQKTVSHHGAKPGQPGLAQPVVSDPIGETVTPCTGAGEPPPVPTCVATPSSGTGSTPVSITCTGGKPGTSVTINGCQPPTQTVPQSGTITCNSTASALGNNPAVTVLDPATNKTSSGTVPFSTNPPQPPAVPTCTASPSVAAPTDTVTITCSGGTPGTSVTIAGCQPETQTVPASGSWTCSAPASNLGSNPTISVRDPATNQTSTGNVNLTVQSGGGSGADFTPSFTAGSTIANVGQSIEVVININQVGTGTSSGQIEFFVANPTGFTVDFNPSRSSATVAGGPVALNNSNWSVTSTAAGKVFRSSVPLGPNARSRVGVTLTPTVAGATASLTVSMTANTGGDTRVNNDTSILSLSSQP